MFGSSSKNTYESDIKLGELYEDTQTGIQGRATAIYFFEFACERVTLERLVEGKIEADTFDAPRLKHVATQQVAQVTKTGGPGDGRTPGRGTPPRR